MRLFLWFSNKQFYLLNIYLSLLLILVTTALQKSLSWAFGFLAQTSEESEKHSATHCSSHPKIGIGDLANKRVFGKGLLGLAWSQEQPNVWWSMEMTHLQQQLKRENLRCCVDTIFFFSALLCTLFLHKKGFDLCCFLLRKASKRLEWKLLWRPTQLSDPRIKRRLSSKRIDWR